MPNTSYVCIVDYSICIQIRDDAVLSFHHVTKLTEMKIKIYRFFHFHVASIDLFKTNYCTSREELPTINRNAYFLNALWNLISVFKKSVTLHQLIE